MKKFLATLSASAVLVGSSLAPVAAHGGSYQVVLPSDLAVGTSSWYFYDDVANTASATQLPGKYEFVNGPATPPAGDDSVQLSVINSERWNMATAQYKDVKIADLTKLKFNTYQPNTNPGNTQNAIYLNFDVDFDGPSGNNAYQGRLVYVPRANGTVQQNIWQEWDSLSSGSLWNWSRYASNGNKWLDNNTSVNRTWSDIVAAFPNATVSGQLLFRAGEPYPAGFTGNLDKVTIGTTTQAKTFDFELTHEPTDKDDCKKDGWHHFNNPTFKNQGQCVAHVERDHDHHDWHGFWQNIFSRFHN